MQLKQLVPLSLVLFQSSRACLHDHILAPRLQDVQESLRKRVVPAHVKTAIQNVRVFDGYAISEPQSVIIDGEYITDCDESVEKIINGSNRVLIPGLIDAHAHVQSVEGLENMTSYGVTTIFNMACQSYELCDSLKSNPGLASLFTTMLAAVGPVGGNDQAKSSDPKFLVDYAFGNGSDYFKIVGAVGGPTQAQQNEMVTISSRADILQHMADDGLLSSNLLKSIKEHDQAATPTMEIFRRAYTIQPEIIQFLRGNNSANSTYENVVENVRYLHDVGVSVLAGTDAVGNSVPGFYFPFGESLHQELVNLVAAGLTPAEALRAATIVPAMAHRLDDRGVIRPGMRADLILLNSDPLINISNTRDISRVWAGGIEYTNIAKLTGV
ncbi:hypothetical protein F5B20DRAFT_567851 [Whalleya microplaca]|nr:hypothetical protein F5B20DRAFT_567851 [Whalleya microplaca]